MYYLLKNIIFLFSFISVYYFKNEEILLDDLYTKLFISYFSIHLFFLIYFRSFDKKTTLYQNIKSVLLSNLYSIVVISLVSTLTFTQTFTCTFDIGIYIDLQAPAMASGCHYTRIHKTLKTFSKTKYSCYFKVAGFIFRRP